MNNALRNDPTAVVTPPEQRTEIREERELQKTTASYALESPTRSWWAVGTTFILLIAAMAAASLPLWWPMRLVFSLLAGLLMVRAFITYHDFMHGSILRDSKLARLIFELYGALSLTPPRSWKKSHNFHHGHIGQLDETGIGSFRVMTAKTWREATPAQRLQYRVERHPLTVLLAYLTVFAINICILPLFEDPKRHWDSAVSLVAHFGLIAALWWFGGFTLAFFVVLLPMAIASALGGYLFFAQHSFKQMIILPPETWSFSRAALESSSYMRLNKLMEWFTGNIGYHHIHHLNVRIPFYRLPEVMAALPALQSPATISLNPRDIMDCFNADLWDEERQRMISFREA
jgi:omega-6 fatty acid desaturase (delta-12 desaturase)